MDQFVALSAAAAVTKTIKLATGICLIIQRDPIYLAREIASLDHISNGRVIFGIGGGWNAEEMENHGTVFQTRFKYMREQIGAMKAIWTQEQAEYHGEFIDLGPIIAKLKPIRKPHPPIVIGGGYPHAAKRAVEYCDGWMPILGGDLKNLQMISEFRQMARDAGRDPDNLSLTTFGLDRTFQGADAYFESEDEIKRFRDAGVDRINFQLQAEGRDEMLRLLDEAAKFVPIAAG
jgi:probable F420-dependent oxidoreductase